MNINRPVKEFPSDVKYEAVLLLAKLGMKPKDVVALTLKDIRVIEGYVVLSIHNKNFRIPMYDAKTFTEYLTRNGDKILTANGIVFHGLSGNPMSPENVKAYIKVYMNKMNMGIGLDDIGWGRGMTKEKTLDTPEGFSSFLDKLKGHLS